MNTSRIKVVWFPQVEEVLITATVDGLHTLANLVSAGGAIDLEPTANVETGFPISRIVVEDRASYVRIFVEDSVLRIVGDRREPMAGSIRFLARKEPSESELPNHIHIEYFPDHFYLSPESQSLVIEARGEDDLTPPSAD